MKTKMKKRVLCFILCAVMIFGQIPTTVFAYHEAPKGQVAKTTTNDYTIPAGRTFRLDNAEHMDSNYDLGSEFLFVIKKNEKYYAMQEVTISEEAYETIPAIDITSWVSEDGKSVNVPSDPGKVAFIRYEHYNAYSPEEEFVMSINGDNVCLEYTELTEYDSDYNVISEKLAFKTRNIETAGSRSFWFSMEGNYEYGTFAQRTRRYMNYDYYCVDYIVDLSGNESDGYSFCWRDINGDNPVLSSQLPEYGRQGDEVEGYLFVLPCRHQFKIDHVEYDAPTCMEKGCAEYWYCHGCERYFKDEALSQPYEAHLNPAGYFEPVLPATGHDWGTEECKNCGTKTPVYTKITNMEEFQALGEKTSFILVAEYNGKTYVVDGGDPEELSKVIDSNDDSYPDIIDIDKNENGTPDCLEIDSDSNEVWDYLETNLYNTDRNHIDWYDYQFYWENMDFSHLYNNVYEANSQDGSTMAVIEVTPNPDGTITLSNERQLSFEMIPMHTEEEIEASLEGYETEEEKATIRQEMRNNMMIKVPNLWLQPYFCWTNIKYLEERPYYGDQTVWNLYFYDDIKDMTLQVEVWDDEQSAFVMKEVSVIPENINAKEGSMFMYSIFDMFSGIKDSWSYDRINGSIRLRDVDGAIDFVGGSHIFDFENSTQIELNDGIQVGVYLYASEAAVPHTCEWGDWIEDEGKDTHTHTCKDKNCGKTETKPHGWDNGTQTKAPSCTEKGTTTYTCSQCKVTKSEEIPELKHEWSNWVYENVDSHTHYCKRNCGSQEEFEGHSWGEWIPVDDNEHKMTCSVCSGAQTSIHDWDKGVVTKQPTEEEEGITTYTCTVCSKTKTAPISKITHEHKWSEWGENDEKTHIRSCSCNATETGEHHFDEGVVINWATHLAPGEIHYTCADCGYIKSATLPALEEHEWTNWTYNKDNKSHSRSCICNKTETEHCIWDDGVVTKQPNHSEEGIKIFNCSVCRGSKREVIAKTETHEWTKWASNNDGTHSRACGCNKNETKDCSYDAGVVTEQPTHEKDGTKTYTCSDCGYTCNEAIPALKDHVWGEWVQNKTDDSTHIRFCICNESQTAPHNFDEGKVTTEATHISKGIKTFSCGDCGYSYDIEIPKTSEHEWFEWVDDMDGKTHTHRCQCGATETIAHSWSTWEVETDGKYKRECKPCGAVEEIVLKEDKPVNITTSSSNAANTNLNNTDIELIEKILTDEEQSQVAKGAEVKIYLKVEDISNVVSTVDKGEAEAKAGDDEIGMYLDIDLFKQINTNESQVNETAGVVTVTITIPENLINKDENVTRTYKVIRVHTDENGNRITDIIEGIFNPQDNSFTFQTDKFSTYALAYADKAGSDTKIEYNVEVTNGEASISEGTVITKAVKDTKVTLTAEEAPSGKTFDKWVVTGATVEDVNSAITTFIMPAGNVTAQATYKDIPVVHICDVKLVAEVEPTCTKSGKKAHYKCDGCGKVYEDKLKTCEITDITTWGIIPPTHKYGSDDICVVCGYNKGGIAKPTLSPTQKQAADKLGLTDEGAKDIISFIEKNNIPLNTIYITEKGIIKQKSEDIKGATFNELSMRATKTTKNKITVKWNKVKGADGYIVYGNKCGTKNKYQKVATLNAKKTSYTKSKCKEGTFYKYVVVAYKLVDGKKVTIAVSKTIHATTTGGKYGNAKAVKVNKTKVNLKENKSFTIKASQVKKDKKLAKHRALAFESGNTEIATVSKKGKITAKKKGTCYIYVYAQNGAYKRIKVTVK